MEARIGSCSCRARSSTTCSAPTRCSDRSHHSAQLLAGVGTNRLAFVKVQVSRANTVCPQRSRVPAPSKPAHPTERGGGCWAQPVGLLGAFDALYVAVLDGPLPTPPGVLGGR